MTDDQGLLVALCGDSGAGKSTTTGLLESAGFQAFSLSGFLRSEAESALDHPTRQQVQEFGKAMNQQHGNAHYATRLIDDTPVLQTQRSVVDGFRNLDELNLLRERATASGLVVVLVALILDADQRFARVQGRARHGDPGLKTQFVADDRRANGAEGNFQNNRALVDAADFRIENTGDIAELRSKLSELIDTLSVSNNGALRT